MQKSSEDRAGLLRLNNACLGEVHFFSFSCALSGIQPCRSRLSENLREARVLHHPLVKHLGGEDSEVLSSIMDKFYLGQGDEKDVDDLLAQINDDSILKLSVNTHQSTNGMRAPLLEDHHEVGKDGIDPDLEARFASLKTPRPKAKEKETTGKSKPHGDVSTSPKQSSKGSIARSTSVESDGGDSLDAELIARLQALKGPSAPSKMPEGDSASKSESSESSTPSLSEHLQALRSRSKMSPQMSPSRSDYPAGITISSSTVGSSGWCAPTSPFKLMRALSSKNPGSEPVPRSSSKSHTSQTTKDAKKAVKKSLSHTSKEEEVDPAAMVEDVQRLLAAVSNEGKKQSREKKAMVAGDKRTFNMKDRDTELLKAMEDEEAIALEAEKVVEWAKDNARLEGPDEESEDELELKVSSSDDSDDSAGAKLKNVKKETSLLEDSDPEETIGKAKKRKGRRRWNFL